MIAMIPFTDALSYMGYKVGSTKTSPLGLEKFKLCFSVIFAPKWVRYELLRVEGRL
ncbi:MAG TPA: hypothetical protein VJ440_00015 [Candidatus Brocadiaceae bacterium]|nr:hypothetical protein [Candidatus Brocadiaceae bacterium]